MAKFFLGVATGLIIGLFLLHERLIQVDELKTIVEERNQLSMEKMLSYEVHSSSNTCMNYIPDVPTVKAAPLENRR